MTHLSSCSTLGQRQDLGPGVDCYSRLVLTTQAEQGGHQNLRTNGCLLLCVRAQSTPHTDPAEVLAGLQQFAEAHWAYSEFQVPSGENCFLILRNALTLLFTVLSSFLKIHEIRRFSCTRAMEYTTSHFYSRDLRGKSWIWVRKRCQVMGLSQAAFSAVYQSVCCTDCLVMYRKPERGCLYGLLQNVLLSGQELQLHTQREVSLLVNETFHILQGLRRGGSGNDC